jgi:hypothetical protein
VSNGSPKLFISYRREDTAGHAGRLYDVMSQRFGDRNVFMDVDLAPGVDFVNRITEAVGDCHVLLVIIGPRWATTSTTSTLPRIFEPEDFVRLEVETGLGRSSVTVIPVLVAGAKMPDPGEVPAPLRALTRRNAIELSDTRWRYDVDRLLGALDGLLRGTSAVHAAPPPPPPTPTPTPVSRQVVAAVPPLAPAPVSRHEPASPARPPGMSPALLAVTTTAAAALTAVIGRAIANGLRWNPEPDDKWGHVVQPVVLGALTWGLVGAVVAVWLAGWLRRTSGAVGPLLIGALTGAMAGAAAAAIYRIPTHIPDTPPTIHQQELLRIAGFAVLGALLGALVGWLWGRHTTAGLLAGGFAGALVGVILRHVDKETDAQRVGHALLAAVLIVGVATATRVLLDARATRPARDTSRAPA